MPAATLAPPRPQSTLAREGVAVCMACGGRLRPSVWRLRCRCRFCLTLHLCPCCAALWRQEESRVALVMGLLGAEEEVARRELGE